MHLSELVSASVSVLFFLLQLACSCAIKIPEAVPRHEVSARIFGGYGADISDFPYQVRLQIFYKQNGVTINQGPASCGGSIISRNFILTAAHCVVQTNYTLDPIEAEDLYVQANSSVRENLIRFPVKNIFKHPHICIPPDRTHAWKKDVAILELFNPLPLGPGIQVIPLAKADSTLPEGTKSIISGWGNTSSEVSKRLQATEVTIVSKEDCENCYGQKDDGLCAGTFEGTTQTKGSLHGDSGGPLIVNGVLEGAIQGAIEGCPDLYVRIASSDIRAFIKNVTGI